MITCCQPRKTARDYHEIYLSIFSHDFRQLKTTTIPGKKTLLRDEISNKTPPGRFCDLFLEQKNKLRFRISILEN